MLDDTAARRAVARPRLETAGVPRRAIFAGAGVVLAAGMVTGCASPEGGRPAAWSGSGRIARDFEDPLLELGHLLKEAAEIEHDLMVQYLYAAFSLKPAYADLIGDGSPSADNLLGVAVQEMQHLRAVNQLLVELGFGPVLTRHDFPEEVDIYPFPFRLEPLSQSSLAKYVYCEAPPGAMKPASARDQAFVVELKHCLGDAVRPNHIGSLYETVIERVQEVANGPDNPLADPDAWVGELTRIKDEGELDHYRFFRSLFMSEHDLLRRHGGIWSLAAGEPRYPVRALAVDPTAYEHHANTIVDPEARSLAWVGNLTYWVTLALLDIHYRVDTPDAHVAAQELMRGPLLAVAQRLPDMGTGMPFDPLSLGYTPGCDARCNLLLLRRLVTEAEARARAQPDLPSGFDPELFQSIRDRVDVWSASLIA